MLAMPPIDRSLASIRFSGKGLESDEVPKMLGGAFSGKPELRQTYKRVGKKGVWSLTFEESDETELENKLQFLLDQLTDDISIWKTLTAKYRADIFCSLFLDGWNCGFSLSARLVKEIADRSLEIGFDIYSPTNTWEDGT
jgi:hypothetical protein